MKRLLLEGVLIAALGAAVALAANGISPRGLKLSYNYFPGSGRAPSKAIPGTNSIPTTAAPVLLSAVQRLKEKGLTVAEFDEVAALFRSPDYQNGQVVFIDARDDEHYQAGHIPGAWQFDRYHWDKHLSEVLPVCLAARTVVVYCKGGECEDSEFAAIMLRDDAHVPSEKLKVFAGGFDEWQSNKLPLEIGERQPPTSSAR